MQLQAFRPVDDTSDAHGFPWPLDTPFAVAVPYPLTGDVAGFRPVPVDAARVARGPEAFQTAVLAALPRHVVDKPVVGDAGKGSRIAALEKACGAWPKKEDAALVVGLAASEVVGLGLSVDDPNVRDVVHVELSGRGVFVSADQVARWLAAGLEGGSLVPPNETGRALDDDARASREAAEEDRRRRIKTEEQQKAPNTRTNRENGVVVVRFEPAALIQLNSIPPVLRSLLGGRLHKDATGAVRAVLDAAMFGGVHIPAAEVAPGVHVEGSADIFPGTCAELRATMGAPANEFSAFAFEVVRKPNRQRQPAKRDLRTVEGQAAAEDFETRFLDPIGAEAFREDARVPRCAELTVDGVKVTGAAAEAALFRYWPKVGIVISAARDAYGLTDEAVAGLLLKWRQARHDAAQDEARKGWEAKEDHLEEKREMRRKLGAVEPQGREPFKRQALPKDGLHDFATILARVKLSLVLFDADELFAAPDAKMTARLEKAALGKWAPALDDFLLGRTEATRGELEAELRRLGLYDGGAMVGRNAVPLHSTMTKLGWANLQRVGADGARRKVWVLRSANTSAA